MVCLCVCLLPWCLDVCFVAIVGLTVVGLFVYCKCLWCLRNLVVLIVLVFIYL